MSNSLRFHELQHDRLPCPLLSPRVCSNSCLLSQWCHPIISSSVTPSSSCLQSFPVSRSFPKSQFLSGGHSIGASALAPVLLMNIQGWFPLVLTGFYLLAVQGTLKSHIQHHSSKASIIPCLVFFTILLSDPYKTTGKTIALTIWIFSQSTKWSLCFLICCLGLS